MQKQNNQIRLQKFLAQAGVASRRASEDLIRAGRVRVNGKTITEMGVKISPHQDKVTVDNVVVRPPEHAHTYIMLNKPRYVLSTSSDEWGKRKTVFDLVQAKARVFPVGRLDFESEGLLLLTTDGDLAQKLTHPSYEHEREYEVLLNSVPDKMALRKWRTGGFIVDEKPVAPMRVEPLASTGPGWLRIILTEGRKRHIREVAFQLGFSVITLIRVRMGPLKLGHLKPGKWRLLSPREVDMLRHSITTKQRNRKPAHLSTKKRPPRPTKGSKR